MTKTIWTGACSAIIAGAVAAAMAQTPAQQNPSPSSDQKITVTGCLKAAPPAMTTEAPPATAATGATGTTGTTGAAGAAAPTDADAKFILADAIVGPAKADTGSAAGAAGTTAAAGAPSAAGASQTYQLVANGAALRPHVGKKLELTGTLVNQPSSSPAAAGPTLKVESGKVIAASCKE